MARPGSVSVRSNRTVPRSSPIRPPKYARWPRRADPALTVTRGFTRSGWHAVAFTVLVRVQRVGVVLVGTVVAPVRDAVVVTGGRRDGVTVEGHALGDPACRGQY